MNEGSMTLKEDRCTNAPLCIDKTL